MADYRSIYARDNNLAFSDDFSATTLGTAWTTGNGGAASTGAGTYNVTGEQLNITKVANAAATNDQFYVKRLTYGGIPSGASVEVHCYMAISDVGAANQFRAELFLSPTNPTGLTTAESQGLRFYIQDSGTLAAATGYTRVLQTVVNGTVTNLLSETVNYASSGVNFDQPIYALYLTGAAYTDNSAEAQSAAGTPFNIITYSGTNYFYFGRPEPFTAMQYTAATTGNYGVRLWQYWNGTAWQSGTALASGATGVTDATTGFNSNGIISWAMPGDWQPTGVGVSSGKTVTSISGTQIDTSQSVFGGASGSFASGSKQILTTPDSSSFAFGSGDFTLETRVRFNVLPSAGNAMYLYIQDADASNFVYFRVKNNAGTYEFRINSTSGGVANVNLSVNSGGLSTGTWYQIAIVRSGSNFLFFQDGVQQGATQVSAVAMDDIAAPVEIGGSHVIGGAYLHGWLDEFRLSNIARWTANFTPASSAYTYDSNTSLLLHMDGTNGSTTFTDDAGGTSIQAYWVRVSAATAAYTATANQILAAKTVHYFHPFVKISLDYANVRVDIDATGTAWLAATGHQLQFRAPLDSAFFLSGATFTDNTAEAASPAGTAFNLLAYSGSNYFYFGRTEPFTSLWFKLAVTGNIGVEKWQYYDGSNWVTGTALASGTVVDTMSSGANGCAYHTGTVSWSKPADWQPTTINSSQKYYVRRSAGTVTAAPTVNQVLAGPANYFYQILAATNSRATAQTATFDGFQIKYNHTPVVNL